MPREFNTLVRAETSRSFSLSTWKHVEDQVSIESPKSKGLRLFRLVSWLVVEESWPARNIILMTPRSTSWICLSFWLVGFLEKKGEFNTSFTGVDTLRVFSGNERIPSFIFRGYMINKGLGREEIRNFIFGDSNINRSLMKENSWNFSCAGNIINRSWRKEHLLWRVQYEVLGGKAIWN